MSPQKADLRDSERRSDWEKQSTAGVITCRVTQPAGAQQLSERDESSIYPISLLRIDGQMRALESEHLAPISVSGEPVNDADVQLPPSAQAVAGDDVQCERECYHDRYVVEQRLPAFFVRTIVA